MYFSRRNWLPSTLFSGLYRRSRRRSFGRACAAAERLEDRALLAATILDPSFGGDGTVTTGFTISDDNGTDALSDTAYASQIQSGGKLFVAGVSSSSSTESTFLTLARFNADGSLDATYGTNGRVISSVAIGTIFSGSIADLAIDSSGRVLAVGTSNVGSDLEVAVARFNPDGSLDLTFGVNGVATAGQSGAFDFGSSLTIDSSGRIIVVGSTSFSGPDDFLVARFLSTGVLDTSFSGDGVFVDDFGGSDFPSAVTIGSAGQIVVVGSTNPGESDSDIAVIRLTDAGILDTTFDTDGRQTIADFDFGTGVIATFDDARGVAIQADGSVVVVGSASDFFVTSQTRAIAVRLTAGGALDAGFGTGGKAVFDFGSDNVATDVAIDANNRAVLAVGDGFSSSFVAARLTAAGQLDLEFDGDGSSQPFAGTASGAQAVTLGPNGTIFFVGFANPGTNQVFDRDFAIAKFALDTPPPIAVADSFDVPESGQSVLNVLSNDTTNGPATIVAINGSPVTSGQTVNLASGSTLVVNANGTLTYTPAASFAALRTGQQDSDSFSYTITNASNLTSTAAVTVQILGDTAPPVAFPDTANAPETGPTTLAVLANDTVDGTPTITRINTTAVIAGQTITLASGSTVRLNANGTLTFTPATNYRSLRTGQSAGEPVFTYTITNEDGETSTANIGVTVLGDTAPPIAFPDTANAPESGPTTLTVLANDTLDGPVNITRINATAVVVGQTITLASGSTVRLNANGTLTFTPATNYRSLRTGETAGEPVFSYTITNEDGETSTANIGVTVQGDTAAPVLQSDSGSTNKRTPVVLNVLANDMLDGMRGISAINGNAVSVGQVVVLPSGSMVRLNANGTLTFTPASTYGALRTGETRLEPAFSYTVTNQDEESASTTVSVTILGDTDPPIAFPDVATAPEGVPTTLTPLANDSVQGLVRRISAINGSPIVAGQTVTLPSGSTVRLNANGTLTYTAGPQFTNLRTGTTAGEPVFSYTIINEDGETSTANIGVTVQGNTAPPIARPDAANAPETGATTISVLNNDTLDGPVTISRINATPVSAGQIVPLASGSTVRVNANGTLTYTPAASFAPLNTGDQLPEMFSYTLSNEDGETSAAAVRVTVIGNTAPPVARPDTANAPESGQTTLAVLDNDTIAGTVTITAINGNSIAPDGSVTLASGSTIRVNAGRTLTYTPGPKFRNLRTGQTAGEPVFTYTIANEDGETSTANVGVTVAGNTDPPVARPDAFVTSERQSKILDILTNDLVQGSRTISAINNISVTVGDTVTLDSGSKLQVFQNALIYIPAAKFRGLLGGQSAGEPTFQYTITNEDGETASANVGVTVTGETILIARPDRVTVPKVGTTLIDVLTNDTYEAPVIITAINGQSVQGNDTVPLASGSRVTVNDDGTLSFLPSDQYLGLQTGQSAAEPAFSYTVSAATGQTAISSVSVTIRGDTLPPVLVAQQVDVPKDGPTAVNVLDRGTIDGDVRITSINGQPVRPGIPQTLPDGSTLVVGNDNTLTFTPANRYLSLPTGQTATLSPITYTVMNSDGESSTTELTIRVIGSSRQLTAIALGRGGSGRPNDPIGGPLVAVYDITNRELYRFNAFDPSYRGGVRVAVGDLNEDGTPDIIAAQGQSASPEIRIFSGVDGSQIGSLSLPASYANGAYVATGDINGDGRLELIVGADFGAAPRVQVFSFADSLSTLTGRLVADFNAFGGTFQGGVRVAAGDVDGDRRDDLVVGSGRGEANVRVYSGLGVSTQSASNLRRYADVELPLLLNATPYAGNFREGVFVAAGNLSGDERSEVIVAPDMGGIPEVVIYSLGLKGAVTEQRFTAFNSQFRGGVRVAVGDANNDGQNEIFVSAGFAPQPDSRAYTPIGNLVYQFPQILPFFRRGTTIASGRISGLRDMPTPSPRQFGAALSRAFSAGLADEILN